MIGCPYDLLSELERDEIERIEREVDRLLGDRPPNADEGRRLESLESERRSILWRHTTVVVSRTVVAAIGPTD